MANDVYETVSKCVSCAMKGNRLKNKRNLQIFPAIETLELVTADIRGILLKTAHRNWYVVVITDRYSKLTGYQTIENVINAHGERLS